MQDSVHATAPYHLADYVVHNNLSKQRATFHSITGDQPIFDDFPNLTEHELILFALGTFQIKLARSYYAEHLVQGLYNIEVYREEQIRGFSDYITERDCYSTFLNIFALDIIYYA